MSRSKNDPIEDYKISVLNYTDYHFFENEEVSNSPRNAVNEAIVKQDTGREFSQRPESFYSHNALWYYANMAQCEFSDGSEVRYHGKMVLTKNLMSFDEMTEMVYWTMKQQTNSPITTIFDDGRVITSYHTQTGKIAYNGNVLLKSTKPKEYTRCRTF
jgi:hypothetical protein